MASAGVLDGLGVGSTVAIHERQQAGAPAEPLFAGRISQAGALFAEVVLDGGDSAAKLERLRSCRRPCSLQTIVSIPEAAATIAIVDASGSRPSLKGVEQTTSLAGLRYRFSPDRGLLVFTPAGAEAFAIVSPLLPLEAPTRLPSHPRAGLDQANLLSALDTAARTALLLSAALQRRTDPLATQLDLRWGVESLGETAGACPWPLISTPLPATASLLAADADAVIEVTHCDSLHLQLSNRGEVPVDVAVFYVSRDLGLYALGPDRFIRLTAGGTADLVAEIEGGGAAGDERILALVFPAGQGRNLKSLTHDGLAEQPGVGTVTIRAALPSPAVASPAFPDVGRWGARLWPVRSRLR
ncbi:hypothetical protein [Phenylobacterium sp.]|uniref:hypothetical protein n=1 Tax=Phenylobacterium sp. TaxID=1871053 RepID=UPI00286D2EF0|nr:hypothetical protein [Phenylobacterium sp.]